MFCINCFNSSTSVTNSRPHKKQPQIWRRRKCTACGMIFTTHERPSLADNKPIHLKGGATDTFNLGKLIVSLSKAFTHSPDAAAYDTFWLAQTIEDTLSTQYKVVTPDVIEAVAHQTLRQFDEVAAMEYALSHRLITSTRRRGRPSLHERGPQTDE